MTKEEAQSIWNFVYHFWPPGSRFRFFARNEERVFGFTITCPSELAAISEWTDKHHYNAYWQINPTNRFGGTRCSAEDITHWCFIPLDIDPVASDPIPMLALWEYEDAMTVALPELDAHKHTIIDSGRGIQALYAIRPHLLHPGERASISDWTSRFLSSLSKERHGCILDTSCSDLPRVMRLPYTINTKTGEKASFISRSHQFALDRPPAAALIPKQQRTEEIVLGLAHWIEFLPHLTVTARKFIEQGAGRGGRHKGATAAMLSLEEKGATPETIISALKMGAAMSSPPLAEGEVTSMVLRRMQKRLTFKASA